METFIPIHTLIKLVDAEYFTKRKIRTHDLPVEVNNIISKVKTQKLSAEFFDPNPEIKFIYTTDPNIKSKPQFRTHCIYCDKSNHSVSNCFRKQCEDEEQKRNSYSRWKASVNSFNQYFRAYGNQIHPNEHSPLLSVKSYSHKSYDSRNHSSYRYRYSPYRAPHFRLPSTSQRSSETSRYWYRYRDREFNSNKSPSRLGYTDFFNQGRNSISPYSSSLRNNRYQHFFISISTNWQ